MSTRHSNGTGAYLDRAAEAQQNGLKQWLYANWKFLVSMAVAAGALWLLPVTRLQLDNAEQRIGSKITLLDQKVEAHDVAIKGMQITVNRVDDNTFKILSKLSDSKGEPQRADAAPIPQPAAMPAPRERTRSRAKRPHAQRVGFLARTLGSVR